MEDMEKKYKRTRILYIIEAAVEYFIAIAVGTVYLAKIGKSIGLSDDVIGVLQAFVSLGCSFCIVSVFLTSKKPVKNWCTIGSVINQVLFSSLYFIPLFSSKLSTLKSGLFIVVLLLAQIIMNVVYSSKTNWLNSVVDDHKRGKFTAIKEIVSLVSAIGFTAFLGYVCDNFSEKTSFIIIGISLLICTIIHTLTLVFSVEKQEEVINEDKPKISFKDELKALFKDKALLGVVLISVFWNIAVYISTPFMGTYQTNPNELNFTTTYASLIIIVSSLARIVVSIPFGKFADKHGFYPLLIICFIIEAIAFGFATFTTPANGKVFYMIYYILYCVGLAGISSSTINLVFEVIVPERRTSTLAIKQSLSGIVGFIVCSVCAKPLIKTIQNNGNKFFGMNIYAQQVLSAISCLVSIIVVLYIVVIIKAKNKKVK